MANITSDEMRINLKKGEGARKGGETRVRGRCGEHNRHVPLLPAILAEKDISGKSQSKMRSHDTSGK